VAEPEPARLTGKAKKVRIEELSRLMFEAAADLRFEDAAKHRDELDTLRG
jgi:excinuclease ABC subunit B